MNKVINGLREGYWEKCWGNGQLWFKGNFLNGERNGYWEIYYSNGELMYKGNYINGVKYGYWEFYDGSKGQLSGKDYYII